MIPPSTHKQLQNVQILINNYLTVTVSFGKLVKYKIYQGHFQRNFTLNCRELLETGKISFEKFSGKHYFKKTLKASDILQKEKNFSYRNKHTKCLK